ncbi:DNA alkylation repair enzyme [compost metagenome]
MLPIVRSKDMDLKIPLSICDIYLYSKEDLLKKATGWVLREIYKKDNELLVNYLEEKNSQEKIPSIVLSYACEKMTIEEKKFIKK